MPNPRYKLYYWPLPFRKCFISYLFAYRNVPLKEVTDLQTIQKLKSIAPAFQAVPFIGPPVLEDVERGQSLSQMPAIVPYVSRELDLLPEDPLVAAQCMKVLMDCNDLLMEICRYNGSYMWDRETWIEFRSERLPRWMAVFAESLKRGFFGREPVTYADISVYAMFGNMIRCLPELEPDLRNQAPGVYELCEKIAAEPTLARYVAAEEAKYGKLYCGGQIEESIRSMLALDADS